MMNNVLGVDACEQRALSILHIFGFALRYPIERRTLPHAARMTIVHPKSRLFFVVRHPDGAIIDIEERCQPLLGLPRKCFPING